MVSAALDAVGGAVGVVEGGMLPWKQEPGPRPGISLRVRRDWDAMTFKTSDKTKLANLYRELTADRPRTHESQGNGEVSKDESSMLFRRRTSSDRGVFLSLPLQLSTMGG